MRKSDLVKAEAALFSVILELEYAVVVQDEIIEEFKEEIKDIRKSKTKFSRKLKKAKEQYKEITGSEFQKLRR